MGTGRRLPPSGKNAGVATEHNRRALVCFMADREESAVIISPFDCAYTSPPSIRLG